jgi:hypothetical protein
MVLREDPAPAPDSDMICAGISPFEPGPPDLAIHERHET